jgi:hypothetical protein
VISFTKMSNQSVAIAQGNWKRRMNWEEYMIFYNKSEVQKAFFCDSEGGAPGWIQTELDKDFTSLKSETKKTETGSITTTIEVKIPYSEFLDQMVIWNEWKLQTVEAAQMQEKISQVKHFIGGCCSFTIAIFSALIGLFEESFH